MSATRAAADPAAELLQRAVALGASDLHVDPTHDGTSVRLRVDGRFVPVGALSRDAGARLLGRLKVLAGLQVYRSDVPQEGRLELPGGREGRLAVIPTPAGEKATLRLFDARATLGRLDDLGFDGDTLAWLRRMTGADAGLVLVVGPSGSGKTTTLYSAVIDVLERRGEFCHVATIEDPVERRLPGCTQVEISAARDLDFAKGLKFLLRQDPEVLMVGEVRDAETARIAVRAAMTGHLVLSSLHCGHAIEARQRLLEMGVEEYAVRLALRGVIAQRLLRRVCTECRGRGCEACLASGFRGRIAIAEVLDAKNERCAVTLADRAAAAVADGVTVEAESERVLGGAA